MGNFLRFFFKKNFILFILIILGFLINLIVIFPSGTYLCLKDRCGLHFWGANEFDGVWHLSLANISFKNGFINPLQSNSSIGNYNFLLDYINLMFHSEFVLDVVDHVQNKDEVNNVDT